MKKKFLLLFAIMILSVLCISCEKNNIEITVFNDSLVPVNENGYWGYLDKSGDVKIGFLYEKVTSFRNERAIVRKDGFYYLIDTDGNYVNTGGYELMEFDKKEDVIIFGSYTCQGLMDFNGKVILKQTYNHIYDFSEGLAVVRMDSIDYSRYGFINTRGKVVIDLKYLSCSSFSDGLAIVEFQKNKVGYINKRGRLVLDCDYFEAESFKNGFAQVNDYTIINKSGKIIFEDKDNIIEEYNGSFISARNRYTSLLFLYNTKGKQLFIDGFRKVYFFDEMIYCKTSTEAYVFTKNGDIIFSSKDEDIDYISDIKLINNDLNSNSFCLSYKNTIYVFNDGKVNSINVEDNLVISNYINYYYICQKDRKYGVIDSNGKSIIDFLYDDILLISNDGYVIVKVNNRYGVIDLNGKIVIEPQYTYIKYGV